MRPLVSACQPRGEPLRAQLAWPANDTTALPPALLALLDDLAVLIARLAYEDRLDDVPGGELTSDTDVPASPPGKAPETS